MGPPWGYGPRDKFPGVPPCLQLWMQMWVFCVDDLDKEVAQQFTYPLGEMLKTNFIVLTY